MKVFDVLSEEFKNLNIRHKRVKTFNIYIFIYKY